jgi:hypothetical protein
MYVSGREQDGLLQGWIKDGTLDLFVWFDANGLVQAQVTAGRDLAEWTAPTRLQTGSVREGLHLNPGAGLIDFDRRPQDERLERMRVAIDASALSAEAKAVARGVLERSAPEESCRVIRAAVQATVATPRASGLGAWVADLLRPPKE